MNSLRPSLPVLIMILLLSIAGVLVRGVVAQSELLWLDELHTSWTVNDSLMEVAGRAADGNQQPIYFWLTWMSVSLFGHSEFSLRLVSMLAGFGTILGAACFSWRWTGSAIVVFVVGFLIAFDDQFVFYGSEARPYALVQCLGVIQVILFCRAIWGSSAQSDLNLAEMEKVKQWPFWWLAIVSVTLAYTHLTAIWLMAAEVIFFLILFGTTNHVNGGKILFRRFAWTALVAIVALIPLIIQSAAIMQRKGNWQAISSVSNLLSETLPMLVSLMVIPIVYVAVAQSIAAISDVESSQKNNKSQRSPGVNWTLAFVFAWAIAPLLIVVALEILAIAPLALPRYTLVGAAGFPVFAGLCIGRLSSTVGRLGLAFVVVMAFSLQNPLIRTVAQEQRLPRFRVEDWAGPIDQLNAVEAKSSNPVILFANVIEDNEALTKVDSRFQDYLLFPIGGMYEIRNRNRLIAAGPTLERTHFSDEQIRLINDQGGAWILIRAQFEMVVEIGDELRNRLGAVAEKEPGQIEIAQFHTNDSPVYLLSVEF